MANTTIRSLPQEIYDELKRRAAKNRRSLNQEITSSLEKWVLAPDVEKPPAFLQELQQLHRKFDAKRFTAKEIEDGIQSGRK